MWPRVLCRPEYVSGESARHDPLPLRGVVLMKWFDRPGYRVGRRCVVDKSRQTSKSCDDSVDDLPDTHFRGHIERKEFGLSTGGPDSIDDLPPAFLSPPGDGDARAFRREKLSHRSSDASGRARHQYCLALQPFTHR